MIHVVSVFITLMLFFVIPYLVGVFIFKVIMKGNWYYLTTVETWLWGFWYSLVGLIVVGVLQHIYMCILNGLL